MKILNRISAFKFKAWSRKQKKVLTWWHPASPYKDYDGIICDGSIRSGKTIACIVGFIQWSVSSFDGELFIISGRTAGSIKRNVLRPMRQILEALGIAYDYNIAEGKITFCNNTYYLIGANNEASQDLIQGMTVAGWLADEVALQPESFVNQAIGRCSVPGSKVWLNCNPESPYHFIKTEYIDQAAEKRLLRIHFDLSDNLTLTQRIRDKYERMFSGVWYKRFILGLWVAAEGAIYDMFSKKHIISILARPAMTLQSWVACDYGTTNPTVFLFITQGVDGNYYVVDEYTWDSAVKHRQKTDSEYADDLKDFIARQGHFPQKIIVDPSAASFITELKKRGFANVTEADNSVIDGIRLTASLFHQFKLLILDNCTGVVKSIESYLWDMKAIQAGQDERPIKLNDHHADALRYFVYTVLKRYANLMAVSYR
jgi:PBSX family phage terminase large subunit